MLILGIIIGIASTLLILFIVVKISISKDKKKEVKYLRKGLYSATFVSTDRNTGKKNNYDVSVEIGEIERTKTKSKIVISGDIKATIYTDDSLKKQLMGMIEGWIDTDDKEIEWFKKHPGDERAKKIDTILN